VRNRGIRQDALDVVLQQSQQIPGNIDATAMIEKTSRSALLFRAPD